MKSKYVLMSLEEDDNEKLTTLLGNKTAKKIISYLSEHEEATQSELAKALDLPISTIHYNLEQLLETQLIEWEHYHYSSKGKEVRHYRLASQYIIIAPKKKENMLETLKKLLPGFVIGIVGTFVLSIQNLGNLPSQPRAQDSQIMMAEASQSAGPDIITLVLQSSAFWFFVGCSITLLSIFTTLMIISYKKTSQRKDSLRKTL